MKIAQQTKDVEQFDKRIMMVERKTEQQKDYFEKRMETLKEFVQRMQDTIGAKIDMVAQITESFKELN